MKPRIMLLDDSKMNLVVAEGFLKEDYEIVSFLKAIDALAYLKENEVDLLLIDVMMPELDGYDFLKLIKKEETIKDKPFIFLTALNDVESEAKGLSLGAVDFISKPIKGEVLKARVKTHIDLYYARERLKKQNLALLENHYKMLTRTKLEALGHLAAGLAHEINNPLGALKSNLASLNTYLKDIFELFEKCLKHSQFENHPDFSKEDFLFIAEDSGILMKDVDYSISRISEIMNKMTFYTGETDNEMLVYFELKNLFMNVYDLCSTEFNYKVELKLPNKDMAIIGNKKALSLAFYQIIKNSIEAMKESYEKEINIDFNEDVNGFNINICDTGVGIDKEKYYKVFNPFYTTKDVGEGFGLGLNVAYDIIVNQHNGEIEFDQKIVSGTKVKIFLPKGE